jgi:hypothetical protein
VHPETFAAVTGSRPELTVLPLPLPHVGYRSSLLPREPRRVEKRIAALVADSYLGDADVHEHISVFPLYAFGVFRGQSLSILRYLPLAADRTRIETTLMLPRMKTPSAHDQALLQGYASLMLDFARRLGDEDKAICESLQRGVRNQDEPSEGASRPGVLGGGERAVRLFQDGYVDYMARFPPARRPLY